MNYISESKVEFIHRYKDIQKTMTKKVRMVLLRNNIG